MVIARLNSSTVEIHDLDDLLRVARQVRDGGGSLVIEGDDGATIEVAAGGSRPVAMTEEAPERHAEDDAGFLASAGGWAGLVDGEALKGRLRAERGTTRPPLTWDLP